MVVEKILKRTSFHEKGVANNLVKVGLSQGNLVSISGMLVIVTSTFLKIRWRRALMIRDKLKTIVHRLICNTLNGDAGRIDLPSLLAKL